MTTYHYADLLETAYEHLMTTQRGAETVVVESLGLDFPTFDRSRHTPDAPVLSAVAGVYLAANKRAAKLPNRAQDLEADTKALVNALEPTLHRLAQDMADRALRGAA